MVHDSIQGDVACRFHAHGCGNHQRGTTKQVTWGLMLTESCHRDSVAANKESHIYAAAATSLDQNSLVAVLLQIGVSYQILQHVNVLHLLNTEKSWSPHRQYSLCNEIQSPFVCAHRGSWGIADWVGFAGVEQVLHVECSNGKLIDARFRDLGRWSFRCRRDRGRIQWFNLKIAKGESQRTAQTLYLIPRGYEIG